jgi:hypothetical protein
MRGSRSMLPAPAENSSVSTSVAAHRGDRASSLGTRRIRPMRSTSDPPVAASAIDAEATRQVSRSASACVADGSPVTAIATSSQQCSRRCERFEIPPDAVIEQQVLGNGLQQVDGVVVTTDASRREIA